MTKTRYPGRLWHSLVDCLFYHSIYRQGSAAKPNARSVKNGSNPVLHIARGAVMIKLLAKNQTGWRLRMLLFFSTCLTYAWLSPIGTSMPSCCAIKTITGLKCPVCGLTRSVHCFLHGDVPASTNYHPLGPAVALVCGVFVAYFGTVQMVKKFKATSWETELFTFKLITNLVFAGIFIIWLQNL